MTAPKPSTFDQTREQTESNRQAIIRAMMDDGMTRDEATMEESRRFCAAMKRFIESGSVVRRTRKPKGVR